MTILYVIFFTCHPGRKKLGIWAHILDNRINSCINFDYIGELLHFDRKVKNTF